ncbi:MAG: hypothetical protein FWC79_05310 [Oscillospiraceae bacterium]|nr:hypothetical protein [Oscillospiraceae bacterium]
MNKRLLEKIREIDEISQLEDFERDNKLFIDPYRINEKRGEHLKKGKDKISKFFDLFFDAVEKQDREKVKRLGRCLREINATRIGYTNPEKNPQGRGFSQADLLYIYDEAVNIEEHIEDMKDVLMLANRVGPDKVSDLTTNIMYPELLDFTIEIIQKYKLEIPIEKVDKWVFNSKQEEWEETEMLVPKIEGEEILFLPKGIVATYQIFSYERFYWRGAYPYLKANPAIHRLVRVLKNGEERTHCKKLKNEYPPKRRTVMQFKNDHPKVYKEYKDKMEKDFWRHNY